LRLENVGYDGLREEAIIQWKRIHGGKPPETMEQVHHAMVNQLRHGHSWYDAYAGLITDGLYSPAFLLLKYVSLRGIQKMYPELASACTNQWRQLNQPIDLGFGNSIRSAAKAVASKKGIPRRLTEVRNGYSQIPAAFRPFQHLDYAMTA
jgi:hypothetical protein